MVFFPARAVCVDEVGVEEEDCGERGRDEAGRTHVADSKRSAVQMKRRKSFAEGKLRIKS